MTVINPATAIPPGSLQGAPSMSANELLGYNGTAFVPVANKAALWLPSGVIDETIIGRYGTPTAVTLSTETLLLVGNLVLPKNVTSTGCTFVSGGTASETLAHLWACVVTVSDLKIKAVSADVTSGTWGTNEIRTFTWEAGYAPTEDVPVYLGLLVASTKMPTLVGAATNGTWTGRAPAVGGTSTGSLKTPLALNTTVTAPTGLTVGLPVAALK